MEKDKRTEDKIFEAATDVFIEKGMDGARMQDIAHRAGINKSLLNYYYRSKDRLFNAVFEMIVMKMLVKFEPVFDDKMSFEDKVRFFFDKHISFLQKNPRLPIFLLNEINRHPERLKNFLSNIDVDKIIAVFDSLGQGKQKNLNITRDSIPQVMTTIVSMSVFPFAAKGILEGMFEKVGIDFDDFLEERKKFAAEFVLAALKNMKA